MTMEDVKEAGAAYMLTYLSEMLFKPGRLYVPEKGAGSIVRTLGLNARIRSGLRVRSIV